MVNDYNDFLRNYEYEPIDLCSIYDPVDTPPPEEFRENFGNPFHTAVERKIGNTWYTIRTECDGREALTDKVKRLIFSEKGAFS